MDFSKRSFFKKVFCAGETEETTLQEQDLISNSIYDDHQTNTYMDLGVGLTATLAEATLQMMV